MDYNISFIPAETPIQASVNRVVSMWYSDVDKFVIGDKFSGEPPFTGALALFAIYSLAATEQYFLAYFDMNGELAKVLQVKPVNIYIYNAPKFESAVLDFLKKKQVVLMPVLRTTSTYNIILKKLPLLMLLEDATPCVGDYDLEKINSKPSLSLSAADRETIKGLATLF